MKKAQHTFPVRLSSAVDRFSCLCPCIRLWAMPTECTQLMHFDSAFRERSDRRLTRIAYTLCSSGSQKRPRSHTIGTDYSSTKALCACLMGPVTRRPKVLLVAHAGTQMQAVSRRCGISLGMKQNLECCYEEALLKSWSGRMDGAAWCIMGESRVNDKRRYASYTVGKGKQDVNRTTQGFHQKCWVYREYVRG